MKKHFRYRGLRDFSWNQIFSAQGTSWIFMKKHFRYRGLRDFSWSQLFGTEDLEKFSWKNIFGTRNLEKFVIRFSIQVRLYFFCRTPFRACGFSIPSFENISHSRGARFSLWFKYFRYTKLKRFMRFSIQRGRYFFRRFSFPFYENTFRPRVARAFSQYLEIFHQIFDTEKMVFLFCRAPFRTRGKGAWLFNPFLWKNFAPFNILHTGNSQSLFHN